MAYVARKIPFVGTPDTNPETKPFFDGADQGKLMIKRCTKCKKPHFYPRSLCPFCFGDTEWEQAFETAAAGHGGKVVIQWGDE